MTAVIPDGFEMRVVPLTTIHANPWNPNRMSERVYKAERESIREYGFIDPIIVRPHPLIPDEWECIDGEHRSRAAADEGIEEVPITPLYGISDAHAKKLSVIFNETRGTADVVLLGELLAGLRKELSNEELLRGLPFSPVEIASLVDLAADDWDHFGTQTLPDDPPLLMHIVTLRYGTTDLETFTQAVGKLQGTLSEAVLKALEAAAARD